MKFIKLVFKMIIGPSVLDSLVSRLTSHLQSLKDVPSSQDKQEESKMILVKGVIQNYIERGVQSELARTEIVQGLEMVYGTELLFSKEVYEWALEKLASIPQVSLNGSPDSPEEEKESEVPLFCEDTVYHASLCCYAVGTRDSSNYKDFFDKDFPCHKFDEVSISIARDKEDVDRYLIARKGRTYFISFLSEPKFSQWPELFTSFDHGKLK